MKNKKAIELEMLGYMIIAVVVLIILVLAFVILKGKGENLIRMLQDLFQFKGK
jgi:hypothetical protein